MYNHMCWEAHSILDQNRRLVTPSYPDFSLPVKNKTYSTWHGERTDDLGGRHFIWGFNRSRLYLSQKPCGSWLFCSQPCKSILLTTYYNILNFSSEKAEVLFVQNRRKVIWGTFEISKTLWESKVLIALPAILHEGFLNLLHIVSGVVLKMS